MVAITELRRANNEFFVGRPIVAVFVGGTSGIGENGVKALARLAAVKSTSLRIYISGRSQENFDRIFAEVKEIYPQAQLIFVRASDLRLLKEVDRVSNEIIRQEQANKDQQPRIDLLCMSQGELKNQPRTGKSTCVLHSHYKFTAYRNAIETAEGVDSALSLMYYSRMKFVMDLLPLLLKAEQPHVVSIFGAGLEAVNFQRDDPSLRKRGNYSIWNARTHAVIMKTLFFEHLATTHPKLGFAHVFPGLVDTPLFERGDMGLVFNMIWKIFGRTMIYFTAHSAADSGSRTLYCSTPHFPAKDFATTAHESEYGVAMGSDNKPGSGAYELGETSEPVKPKYDYVQARKDGLQQEIWDHTQKLFSDIEKSGKTEE